jgi:hypothetical protein
MFIARVIGLILILIVVVGLIMWQTGVFRTKTNSKDCKPTDDERKAAGDIGVLTFVKNDSGNCVADTCNTVAGYTLSTGRCSKAAPMAGDDSGSKPAAGDSGSVKPSSGDSGSKPAAGDSGSVKPAAGDSSSVKTVARWGICSSDSDCKEQDNLCLMSDVNTNNKRCLTTGDCQWAAWTSCTTMENKCITDDWKAADHPLCADNTPWTKPF